MFPGCIKKLSRKGFSLRIWDELDKLPSRPNFCYSWGRKKKFSWTFSIRLVFWFLTSVPEMEMSGYEEDGRDSSAILVT